MAGKNRSQVRLLHYDLWQKNKELPTEKEIPVNVFRMGSFIIYYSGPLIPASAAKQTKCVLEAAVID